MDGDAALSLEQLHARRMHEAQRQAILIQQAQQAAQQQHIRQHLQTLFMQQQWLSQQLANNTAMRNQFMQQLSTGDAAAAKFGMDMGPVAAGVFGGHGTAGAPTAASAAGATFAGAAAQYATETDGRRAIRATAAADRQPVSRPAVEHDQSAAQDATAEAGTEAATAQDAAPPAKRQRLEGAEHAPPER
jgi:hypothetical protein